MSAVAVIKAQNRLSPRACLESWSVIYAATLTVRQVWPSIWMVPLAGEPKSLVTQYGPDAGTLLEVGASNTSAIRQHLQQTQSRVQFFSFDIDRRTQQDFYAWEEVNRAFELIACFEVIEHLPLAVGLELCGQALEHLQPGGIFVIGTPNIFHPTRYLQDPTHITPWAYDRLAGALLALGFDICAIHRQRDFTPSSGRWRTRLMRKVAMKLQPHLGLDFANSVYVVAQRPVK